ncbi:MAG: hypothetical protein KDD37_06535 [Bdellovibrionales bacterium]|nr:hypothetical protein [Bdellovibrionales bacterium]
MRLLVVSLVSILLSACVVLTLRYIGLSQEHMTRKHPFLSDGPIIFSVMGDSGIEEYPSLKNMAETKKRLPQIGWSLPLYIENDSLVAKVNGQSIPLSKILSKYPNDYYFFQIMENKENINYLLNEQIKAFDLQERVLLFSPFRNVLLQFRELRPHWLTGLSTPEANFFLLSHKLKLETIAPFPADFLWLDIDSKVWLQDLSKDELQRRNKFLICDPLLQTRGCKAYTTDSPTTYSADLTSS